jgi:hypothetical protein
LELLSGNDEYPWMYLGRHWEATYARNMLEQRTSRISPLYPDQKAIIYANLLKKITTL